MERIPIEELKYSLNLVQYWIEKADNKVSISLGLFPVLTAIIQYINSTVVQDGINPSLLFWMHIIEIVSLFCIIIAILFFLFALKPNLKSGGKRHERKKYLLYYGDIQGVSLDSYKKIISEATDKDYANELINEIHFNSGICYKKMEKYKAGVVLSLFSFFGQLFSFCVYLLS